MSLYAYLDGFSPIRLNFFEFCQTYMLIQPTWLFKHIRVLNYGTLKPSYSEQVRQTLFVHYIEYYYFEIQMSNLLLIEVDLAACKRNVLYPHRYLTSDK